MTIPENIRDVALKIADAIPSPVMWIVFVFVVHDAVLYYSLSNVASERIQAVIEIVKACLAK